MTFGSVLALVLFAGLILAVSLQVLAASGHFPRQARHGAMKRASSVLVLWMSIALSAAALVTGGSAVWQTVSWEALVIAAGLAILAAPLMLQQFPDRFVDGRAALLTFAATAVIFAAPLVFGSFR